jgi:cytochrome c-type biogenesis protein CcmH/NrfF
MFIQAEMVVLLWFLPVALNIILPLAIGSLILLNRLIRPGTEPVTQAETPVAEESDKRMQQISPKAIPA